MLPLIHKERSCCYAGAMPVQRTTCEHEAWQQPYPQFAWFYLLKVVAFSATMLFLVRKTWFHGKPPPISNKLNHYDMAKKAGPGPSPCRLVPKGPQAR